MKKIIQVVLSVIVVSVLVFLGYAILSNQIEECIIIQGRNDNWELKEYKVLKTHKQAFCGDGEIIYIGDKHEIKELKYLEFEIVKIPISNEGKTQTLYNRSISSEPYLTLGDNKVIIGSEKDEFEVSRFTPDEHEYKLDKYNDFVFNENYYVKLVINIEKQNGEKVKEEIILDVLRVNKNTFKKVSTSSK